MKTKTNKQIKQMIAGVAGGDWTTNIRGRPFFYRYAYGRYGVYGMFSDLGIVSIKANEVK